jgi:hypothetical protein
LGAFAARRKPGFSGLWPRPCGRGARGLPSAIPGPLQSLARPGAFRRLAAAKHKTKKSLSQKKGAIFLKNFLYPLARDFLAFSFWPLLSIGFA